MNLPDNKVSSTRLPNWLKKRVPGSQRIHRIKKGLRGSTLHTVCEEARCPNLGECFSRGVATIMIMGDVCTRHCGFCAVKNGEPKPLDRDEPRRVALQFKSMGLGHAVITSVTRDDLPDGGAAHFAQTISEVRRLNPHMTIEVLTPDFGGREVDIRTVCEAGPDVFNHNIETVGRLTPIVRYKAIYRRSLEVLRMARRMGRAGTPQVKSGLMVGLGETFEEVVKTLSDLKEAGCDIVTIGQYLRPSKKALPVVEYIKPEVFKMCEEIGRHMGFRSVLSGPFVRSSYMADVIARSGATKQSR